MILHVIYSFTSMEIVLKNKWTSKKKEPYTLKKKTSRDMWDTKAVGGENVRKKNCRQRLRETTNTFNLNLEIVDVDVV